MGPWKISKLSDKLLTTSACPSAPCMSGLSDKFKKDTTVMPESTTTMKESTMKPTDPMTDAPTEPMTERPRTEAPMVPATDAPTEAFYSMVTEGNNKCGTSTKVRSFKVPYSSVGSVEACARTCYDHATCTAITIDNGENPQHCIGCITLNQYFDDWTAYAMVGKDRRQLSELEQLRAENAALKAELARRN